MELFDKPFFCRTLASSALAAGAFAATRTMAHGIAPPIKAESPMGPFFPVGYSDEDDFDLTVLKGHNTRALGEVIEVSGRVLDRYGKPMENAVLDIWQANSVGRYAHANEQNTAPLGIRTPHIHFTVTGSAHKLVSQMCFPEETKTNVTDFLYKKLGATASTSVVQITAPATYRWDIVLMDATA